jgi:hypothetical protein
MSESFNMLYGGIVLTFLHSLWNYIPWACFFLLIRCTGIRLYVITEREVCTRIQTRAKHTSHITDNGKGYGYSIGYWYFMEISVKQHEYGDEYKIWIVATEASFKQLTIDSREHVSDSSDALVVIVRHGNFNNPWFYERKIYGTWKARPSQLHIIKNIRALLSRKDHPHAVVYLHGPPGTGKSMIGILLAQSIHGSYCNTLRPWQPGDTIAWLWNKAEPTAEKPLVIVFDEVDTALLEIHRGIPRDRVNPISVPDKPGWNRMLDEFNLGMYPYTVLILTSNKDPKFINDLDPSYIRKNRVDKIFELKDVVN